MRNHLAFILLFVGFSSNLFSQNVPVNTKISEIQAFQIFTKDGKKVDYEKFIQSIQKSIKKNSSQKNIILFGELHDNPIAHWLELQTTINLQQSFPKITLGAEMFETDQQSALNDYLNPTETNPTESQTPTSPMMGMPKDPSYEKLKKSVKLWNNFYTDYKPLVDFAKENKRPFIATNIPRKYATLVYKKGINSLYETPVYNTPYQSFSLGKNSPACDTGAFKPDFKSLLPPIFSYDSTLKCYTDIFQMAGGHGGQNLPMSQAVKDNTMAYNIFKNYQNSEVFIHYNGSYHSDNFQSIVWYLKNLENSVNIVTISTRTQTNVQKLDSENKGIADFIIVVPENMTRTY